MYCPSCDKSYGAIHSRCPECHSWLKVSAPSGSKGGGAKPKAAAVSQAPADSSPSSGAVSTLSRDMAGDSWTSQPAATDNSGSAWSGGGGGGSSQWADAGTSGSWSQDAVAQSPAPSTSQSQGDGWSSGNGGGGGWGGDSSDGWGGGATTSNSPQSQSQAPPPQGQGNGWLGDSQDGWGGGGGLAESKASSPAPSANQGGWLGGGSDSEPEPASPSSSGWLSSSGADEPEQEPGWLGSGVAAAPAPSTSRNEGGGGWLGDDDSHNPSMTEMVDHAISVEDGDDFVDDSWVDEEIRDNEFDELDVPEFVAPSSEVGGDFLKMALVAVLVVLIGGGLLFLRNDSKSPEELAADAIAKQLEFGRMTRKGGEADLEKGQADLAIPQFEQALVALTEGKAPAEERDELEILLGRALMKAGEYEEAHKHWKRLKKSENKTHSGEAEKGVQDASRALRLSANELLKEAKTYAGQKEARSVLSLGREALKIYKDYGGNNGQKGNAYGIIGRGHLNDKAYADAEANLKKAVALAPNLGYQAYLKQASAQLAPKSYIKPMKRNNRPARRAAPRVGRPSLGDGPGYKKNNRRVGRRAPKRRASSGGGAPAAPKAAPRRMKELPAYRPTQKRRASNTRKGRKGVLKSY